MMMIDKYMLSFVSGQVIKESKEYGNVALAATMINLQDPSLYTEFDNICFGFW